MIQKNQGGEKAPEFALNRIQMRDEHMKEICKICGDKVRAMVPLFETEVKGARMINRLVEHLFASP